MANIEQKVETLISKVIENLGYELYDVIYEKEAKDYYLRIFIDNNKGIGLDDCEKVNDAITNLLDEANYIKEQYFLEVSSPGVERLLRKEKHFETNIGKQVLINLFKPITINTNNEINQNNQTKKKIKKQATTKQIEGILKQFNEQNIIIEVEKQELTIPKKDISNIRLKYNW